MRGGDQPAERTYEDDGGDVTDKQKRLIELIKNKSRLLTEEEVIDFYLEAVQRKTCRLGIFEPIDAAREYEFYEIRAMAQSFYLRAIGRMCVDQGLCPWK